MARFRVAISGDFINLDGSPAFFDFDMSSLHSDLDIDLEVVGPRSGIIPAGALEGFDALILMSPRFTAQSVPADGRLALIARYGVSTDNVDLDACTEAGIAVSITPDGVRRPVAVSILTYILALSQRLGIKDRITRLGSEGWAARDHHIGTGLKGRVLGSLGIGNVGAELYRLAAPLEMEHIAHDPFADPKSAGVCGVRLVGLDELFARSDFLSVSCPLTDETRRIVNADRLARMKPTAFLINTARGPIVDQRALTEALREGWIAGAGLDVFDHEPTAPDDPLMQMANVILSPHSICWTDQCFADIGACNIDAVEAVRRGEVPHGLANRAVLESAAWRARRG
ncbi:NAD(P)-dependent oxidoreductase [Acuticoccus sp. MNP-M23]|uniref:NAD(P)-dependent oxidoreductase n=1 Tax=Acuticoccus sp. MNP-M23 TaxID=3072793 RepID=UPI002815E0C4|nr:NAD(P)-dependent oxidoreductase [Acuticoccus sp. MNP-M23]WMS43566.1 NAD(P)-dependent oxidoreductase [Acuticoccus sp. MNP-M23]